MASVVDIVNRALSKLGDMRISSLADPTEAAGLAASVYEAVRDAEIAVHAWNFAKSRIMLPADCLRVLQAGPWPQAVMDGYVDRDTRSFVIEGRKILTNHGPALNLIYLRQETDSGLYPPAFVEALAAKLAVEMAESLTGSNSKRELAWKEYEQAVKQARRINAVGLPPMAIQDDSWMLAHLGGVI